MNQSAQSTGKTLDLNIEVIKNDIEKNRYSFNSFQHENKPQLPFFKLACL